MLVLRFFVTLTFHTVRSDLPNEWCVAVEWLCRSKENRPQSIEQLTDAIKRRNIPPAKWHGVDIDKYLGPVGKLFQEGTEHGMKLLAEYKQEWLTESRAPIYDTRPYLPLYKGFERTIIQQFGDPEEPLLGNGKMIMSFIEAERKRSPEFLACGTALIALNQDSYWDKLLNDPKVNLQCKNPEVYCRVLNDLSAHM